MDRINGRKIRRRPDPHSNSAFAAAVPLTQVLMPGCIAQHAGENVELDAWMKQITNNVCVNA